MQPLYIDALNWLDDFWDTQNGPRNPWEEYDLFRSRIHTFATVAGASGYNLVAVIDADTKTASAQTKWRERRERELHAERRNIPLSLDGLYADALHQEGIQVIQPIGADADDVLAALAAAHNAPLLSKDRDFFRYDNCTLRVCTGYSVAGGRLVLQPATSYQSRTSASRRPIDGSLLKHARGSARPTGASKYMPSLRGGLVRRGVSSSSDKRCGNLHLIAAPLRAAVYAQLGEAGATEEMPVWDHQGSVVRWPVTWVPADPALLHLLKNPEAALAWLTARDSAPTQAGFHAQERSFNRCALVAEMCSAAGLGSMLQIQGQFVDRQKRVGGREAWAGVGTGAFGPANGGQGVRSGRW